MLLFICIFANMGRFKDFASRFNDIDINWLIDYTLNETKSELIALNQSQLQDGELTDGSFLPVYSEKSQIVYGKPPIPWTLKDSGAFYKAFVLEISAKAFNVTSTDSKTDMLIDKVNVIARDDNTIFGLTSYNLTKYANEIFLPLLSKNIKSYLNV